MHTYMTRQYSEADGSEYGEIHVFTHRSTFIKMSDIHRVHCNYSNHSRGNG